jgi:hypothetical protein
MHTPKTLCFEEERYELTSKMTSKKFVQGSEKETKLGTKVVIQSSKNKGKKLHKCFRASKLQTIGLHNLVSCMGRTRSHVLNKTMFVFFAF